MAYQGWLLKVGDYPIDAKRFIKPGYSAYINVQDLDSYRDANGVLHRDALEHAPIKIEWETPAMLTDLDMEEFFTNIRRNYIIPTERKVIVTAYIPELCDYVTKECYFPDIKPTMYGSYDGRIHYNSMRFALIGY